MSRKTEVKCSKSMLTVGFHTAHPPLIWRFDLERNHSFTLSLQGEEGDWELGITSPKGEFYPVVHFASREEAEEALAAVEKKLAGKTGSSSLLVKALAAVGILAIVIGVGVVLFGLSVRHQTAALSSPIAGSAMPMSLQQQLPPPEGVPVSADDVLKAPN